MARNIVAGGDRFVHAIQAFRRFGLARLGETSRAFTEIQAKHIVDEYYLPFEKSRNTVRQFFVGDEYFYLAGDGYAHPDSFLRPVDSISTIEKIYRTVGRKREVAQGFNTTCKFSTGFVEMYFEGILPTPFDNLDHDQFSFTFTISNGEFRSFEVEIVLPRSGAEKLAKSAANLTQNQRDQGLPALERGWQAFIAQDNSKSQHPIFSDDSQIAGTSAGVIISDDNPSQSNKDIRIVYTSYSETGQNPEEAIDRFAAFLAAALEVFKPE